MKTSAHAFAALCCVALALMLILTGCTPPQTPPEPSEKLIYTTFYPLYMLSEPLFKDIPDMTLTNLVQPQDGCLRNYELSDWDIALIAASDGVIIGGRGLESFEANLTSQAETGVAVISAMDGLTLKGQGVATSGEDLETHFEGTNPWLFLSVDGASDIMESIAGSMIALDPGYESQYTQNLESAKNRLAALKGDMLDIIISETPKPVALMHEGLIYMADELGLNAVCTIEREPGTSMYDNDFKEALITLESSGAEVILLEKQAPDNLKTALQTSGYKIALIDTLTTAPKTPGLDLYISAMLQNAKTIANTFSAP